jgi:ubiquitin carboxyl-terminal hydrolase 25/28
LNTVEANTYNIISSLGKTAPRLVQDIQLYDPAHDPATGRNLLSETPPVYSRGYKGPLEFISPKACKHAYVLKKDQTFLAQTEHRRRPGTSSKVSAMCSKCRCHLQVVVNYTSNVHMFNQTLKGEHMHHLVYKSGRQKNGLSMPEITNRGQEAETFHYQCSYTSCAAMVSLRILSPVLSPDFIHLMTDRESLRKRADQAIAAYRDTMEGMGPPEPISVLEILRLYITNALRNPQRSKSIAPGNKRFMHSFGVEGAACKELLEFLEFVYEEVRDDPRGDIASEVLTNLGHWCMAPA